MLSKAKCTSKSLPALVIEFDQVMNGAMNEALGYHESGRVLRLYVDRLTTIRSEVVKRLEMLTPNTQSYSRGRIRLSQTASYMTRVICEQEDRIATMQKPSSVKLPPAPPGRCRYCRCTDARACEGGCAWYDRERTVCDSPDCVLKFLRSSR
jgi:hypothetical protein